MNAFFFKEIALLSKKLFSYLRLRVVAGHRVCYSLALGNGQSRRFGVPSNAWVRVLGVPPSTQSCLRKPEERFGVFELRALHSADLGRAGCRFPVSCRRAPAQATRPGFHRPFAANG